MNSITRHLTPASLAATLFAMRSGKKSIFLVVEGSSDVALLTQLFSLPHSNMLSCGGKNNLMELIDRSPAKGIDSGTVFFRDRDHDGLSHHKRDECLILFTDHYDIELDILLDGVFPRLFREYATGNISDDELERAWGSVLTAAAWIGALRMVGTKQSIPIDFDGLKFSRFLDNRTLTINSNSLVTYICAKSKLTPDQISVVKVNLMKTRAEHIELDLVCGKDLIDILSLAISRHYQYCDHSECSPVVINRIIRVKSEMNTLRKMSFFPILAQHVGSCDFKWDGAEL